MVVLHLANLKLLMADEKGENSLGSLLLAGGVAGAIAAGIVTPSDVVKTRLQVKGGVTRYGNMTNALRVIVKEEGPWGLYKVIQTPIHASLILH